MKGRVVVLSQVQGREAAALMVDGQLEDLLVAAPEGGAPGPGAVFRGLVDRQMKGQGGVFLRLPGGARAFLREAKGLSPGQALLVQVTGHAEPGKAVPVTPRLLFKSRFAIVTPDAPGLNLSRRIRDEDDRARLSALAAGAMAGSAMGLILRSAAAGAEDGEIAADIAAMRDLGERIAADPGREAELLLDAPGPHELAWRDWADPPPDEVAEGPKAFAAHGVLDALDALRSAEVALGGGATMWVEPTRALIAVDVNTGGDTTPAASLKANIAAARELPRQLRLRGLGGQVAIDFAPMPKNDRRTVEGALRAALKADPVETALVGWTPLGHYEAQRKRERLPLAEALR
ncbi:MAG: ribonuclease E/G [Rhodobacteraceae bacterium]|jgi:Ribonuclease G/E|nr:ribonuclease E/G [Paracoccaceae bacterium]